MRRKEVKKNATLGNLNFLVLDSRGVFCEGKDSKLCQYIRQGRTQGKHHHFQHCHEPVRWKRQPFFQAIYSAFGWNITGHSILVQNDEEKYLLHDRYLGLFGGPALF